MNSQSITQKQLTKNLINIQEQITQAAQNCMRSATDITLIAVSKTQTAETIRLAYELGQRAFGENYVQEAKQKKQSLNDLDIEWHFIGPIQTNKTRIIAEQFDWVHSVDREKIALRLSNQRPENLPPLNICLQVNIDDESTKSGVSLNELPTLITKVSTLPNLKLRGLMTIPSKKESYEDQLIAFKLLADAKAPFMDTLSMGMSNDLSAAIVAGSTLVRIGTAIFGKRHVQ